MNYLERYRKGEYEQVWSELQALGADVRREPHYEQARQVADETMRRVRHNCELLVSRLRSAGYVFGVYPDGSDGYYSEGPLVLPSDRTRADSAELEAQAGPIPLSLMTFWQRVGSVDLVGMHSGWPTGLDPLVVYSPEAALSEIDSRDADEGSSPMFEAIIAPDDLHKDNISGGAPYTIALGDPSADSLFLNERHGLLFVPYLRLAILRWGGFPGLEEKQVRFEPLNELIAGLEPF